MPNETQVMTLVLDTHPWCIEYAQYDSLFQFYPELGIKEVIYRAYANQAKSRNDSGYVHSHEQAQFANQIEFDYHDMWSIQLEHMNERAREYMERYSFKEALLIDQVCAEILAKVHRTWRHLFPHQRAVFHPTTLHWHDDAFSIEASVEPIHHKHEV
jgi:predicted metalloprotease